jgi:hypothetical protein
MVWFGFLALFFLVTVAAKSAGADIPLPLLFGPIAMAGFGYFLMKNLVFDLVDEVWDAGSELLVKNKGRQARIALAEVVNVSYSVMTNPQRVSLTLRQPTVFGREITFAAPTTWIPFAKSPVIEDLIERIDAARRGTP